MQLTAPTLVQDNPMICLSMTGSFKNIDVTGSSMNVALLWADLAAARETGALFLAIQIAGTGGRFEFEDGSGNFKSGVSLTLTDDAGYVYGSINFVSSGVVSNRTGGTVSDGLLYVDLSKVPEPSQAVLTVLGACALLLRRRRKQPAAANARAV